MRRCEISQGRSPKIGVEAFTMTLGRFLGGVVGFRCSGLGFGGLGSFGFRVQVFRVWRGLGFGQAAEGGSGSLGRGLRGGDRGSRERGNL